MENIESRDWDEFPIHIPHGKEHLSAVITVPRTDVRGMVLLMSGYGAPRSHRFQMWARTARRLAQELELASIRTDYVGFGDSTGLVLRWGWAEDINAASQASTAARVGLDVLGVDRFVAVANCTGAASSVRLATEMPECIGALSFLMPVLRPPTDGVKGRLRGSKAASVVRDSPFLKRYVARPIRDLVHRTDPVEQSQLARKAIEHARLLFVYGTEDWMYSPRVKAEFERVLGTLPEEYRSRFELKVFPDVRFLEFESVAIQQVTIDTVMEWAAVCFSDPLLTDRPMMKTKTGRTSE